MSDSIGLFITCLADAIRPSIPRATAQLLEECGYRVEVPQQQVCCGQPAYNSGDDGSSRAIAQNTIALFESFDYVVAPSGSCMGMIKTHYPSLFADDDPWHARAVALAQKSHEILSFLVEVADYRPKVRLDAVLTYHDSCAGLRELGIKSAPRKLIEQIEGVTLSEMADAEVCCGFGGTFCVKYPEISVRLADNKIASAQGQSPSYITGGDLGCLLNICGRASRTETALEGYHLVEILAGYAPEVMPIGKRESAASGVNDGR